MSNVKIIELLKGIRDGLETGAIKLDKRILTMINKIGIDTNGIEIGTVKGVPVTMPTSTLAVNTPVNVLNDVQNNVVPFSKNDSETTEKGKPYTLKKAS